MKCPITGQPCSNEKAFHISEVTDTTTSHLILCHVCAKPYFEDQMQEIQADSPAKALRTMVEFISQKESPLKKKKESIEKYIEKTQLQLKKSLLKENFEAAAIINEKIRLAMEVKNKKDDLMLKLDEYVKNKDFAKAKKVQDDLRELLSGFFI